MAIIDKAVGRGAATASFEYDFSVHGGAVGAITLTALAGMLPDNACIVGAYLEPLTDLTSSGSATVKIGVTGNDDALIAATAYNHASFDGPDKIVALTAEVPLKLTADCNVLATVATAALTAGKFRVHVDYIAGL